MRNEDKTRGTKSGTRGIRSRPARPGPFRISHFAFLISALSALAAPPPLPANSLYQLETAWTQDDGTLLRLADLRGKPRVLTMFFSRCDNVCPMLAGQLKTLEREMPADLRRRVGFVLVTLDPEDDDAETLAEYRRRMDLASDRWTLLRGGPDDTRELAHLLGVAYMPKKADGQIDHNGIIAILDAEGRIIETTPGIEDRKAFLKLLEKASKGRKGKTE